MELRANMYTCQILCGAVPGDCGVSSLSGVAVGVAVTGGRINHSACVA